MVGSSYVDPHAIAYDSVASLLTAYGAAGPGHHRLPLGQFGVGPIHRRRGSHRDVRPDPPGGFQHPQRPGRVDLMVGKGATTDRGTDGIAARCTIDSTLESAAARAASSGSTRPAGPHPARSDLVGTTGAEIVDHHNVVTLVVQQPPAQVPPDESGTAGD